MLDFISPKIIAVAQIGMAIGIIRFWFLWFRTSHNQPWLPTGYIEHERCFVFPDTVMSMLMIVSAALLLLGFDLGERLTLVCGGLMLFLTVIDTAYLIQNGMLANERGGTENRRILIAAGIMSFVMIFRFI